MHVRFGMDGWMVGWVSGSAGCFTILFQLATSFWLVRSLALTRPLSSPHFRGAKEADSSTPIIDKESWMGIGMGMGNWKGIVTGMRMGIGPHWIRPYFVDFAADKSGSL